MTVAPVMFRTLTLRNGVRVLPVGRYEHYVTSDRGIAVVGPVRHRISRWRKKKDPAVGQSADRHLKMLIQGQQMAERLWRKEEPEDKVLADAPRVDLGGIAKQISNAFPPPPPRRRTLRDRMRSVWNGFCDTETHKVVQHAAVDVILWSLAITTAVLCAKVIMWAL
jgi:hypothetical protein